MCRKKQHVLYCFFCRHEELPAFIKELLRDSKTRTGPTTKYLLNTTKITEGFLRKERIGEKDDDKSNKVILLFGETGTGKSTFMNAMVNYIMGVRWEHKIWLEIVNIPEVNIPFTGYPLSIISQTTAVTVYEFFSQHSPFSLTIIDTPGFGDTKGSDKDKRIAEALQQLFRSEDGIHEIHAVCLLLKSTDSRLHDRQLYVLDQILSLFGKDIEKNILLLFTQCSKKSLPKNKILNFIKDSGIKCAKRSDGQYIYFHFDNCQSECYDEEDRESYKSSWDYGIENFRQFFDHLNGLHSKSLDMTKGVLRARKQLDACVNNLKDRIKLAELRQTELEQTQTALRECENDRKERKNFQCEVDEPYKDLVKIVSPWWHLSKTATRCTECEENCHYPGCWWVKNLSWCSVMMKEGKCTVCTGKCHYTKHVKDDKIYEIKTKKVTRTDKDLKERYENTLGKNQSLMCRL
ncbi:uncharacterized protein LOC130546664 [Triplophysa rosa]|uniref:uncharacterized protein LOC130546664 n=1 Tax=Triplophysa rosa TaxID=992332 RepID=UPI002546323C|nr:uncharacterized protein LOC130546664 [Triplophysa rosa]